MKTKPKRAKTSISTDIVAPRRLPPLASEAPPAAKPIEDVSWKTDPDLRAFACLLSFEAGWMTEPGAIAWTFEREHKIIDVARPQGNPTNVIASRGALTMNAEATIAEVRRRWGVSLGDTVEIFAFPDRAKAAPAEVLGARARYLRQLARQTWQSACRHFKPDDAVEMLAASYVDLLRTVADRIRTANTGDQSASAGQTRNVAVARVLDLINPQGS